MSVFLGFGQVELPRALRGEDLGQRLVDDMLGEGHRAVEVLAVARHRREVDAGLKEALRELPGPVRAEVEEDGGVVLAGSRRGYGRTTGSMNSSVIPAS